MITAEGAPDAIQLYARDTPASSAHTPASALHRLDPKLVGRARAASDGATELDRILAVTAAFTAALASGRR